MVFSRSDQGSDYWIKKGLDRNPPRFLIQYPMKNLLQGYGGFCQPVSLI